MALVPFMGRSVRPLHEIDLDEAAEHLLVTPRRTLESLVFPAGAPAEEAHGRGGGGPRQATAEAGTPRRRHDRERAAGVQRPG
ncbi:MAG: hypothetical protein ACK41C_16225 [Phenylobacterium sp.]|uniref:hypothetical protein n=1 Tax=Phenylobacterium sp. TaxID=1871053 RepID=UPI00391AD566